MSRLRIRIELNRGGVGVPLHKLASVVDEAQKFFHMLAEDVQVDQSKGEWLGFDFDNESLNFTAEFVGPVTAEQVRAFHAAFDGTTSLRRTTIAQFARITEAIEEDELIGFGLYLTDEGSEPTEWRCLSRRDALRIAEEIQLLAEASGEYDPESHLPAVENSSMGSRLFSERRERAIEPAKWGAYIRDVEANLDRRITRVEKALDNQSGLIGDLHTKSSATEESVRKLLTAVEGFCAQTTRQLEAMSTSTPLVAAPQDKEPPPALTPEPTPEPAEPVAAAAQAVPEPAPALPPVMALREKLSPLLAQHWRVAAATGVLAVVVIALGVWALRKPAPRPANQEVAAASAPSTVEAASAVPAQPSLPGKMRLALNALEPTWVSLKDADGKALLEGLMKNGDERNFELQNGAILRVGNAGGLSVRLNGKAIGSLGRHGQVTEVVFRGGGYKTVPRD
jgi:hypothetical protein